MDLGPRRVWHVTAGEVCLFSRCWYRLVARCLSTFGYCMVMGETTGVSSLGCRCGAGTLGRSGERAPLGALDWAFGIILWQLVLREMMPSGF